MKCSLQDIRWKTNLSLTQLSRKSGVAKSTISAIENGNCKDPQTSTTFKLADALHVDVREIFKFD